MASPMTTPTPVHERFAHLSLVSAPTPLSRLPRTSAATGSDVWVKRDDLSSPAYGGNKVRKLEFLLAEAKAQGADTLVTLGAVGSHHVLATAIHGGAAGFAVHAVVLPQPPSAHAREVAALHVAHGVVLHPADGILAIMREMKRVTAMLTAEGKKPYVIAPGGSSPLGALGYVAAGLELAAQVEAGEMPMPDRLFVALGSGSTVAGLALGLALADVKVTVEAVRITGPMLMNRFYLWRLVRGTARLLREGGVTTQNLTGAAMKRVHVATAMLGAGYGHPTAAGNYAMELAATDGLLLEPTYTAKAFAGLIREGRGRPGKTLLYWHTLAAP